MRKLKKRQKGFTLIELIVVVAIIAILAAIAVPAYNNGDRASRTAALANARIIISSVTSHNALCDTDTSLSPITGTTATNGITISGTNITSGTAVANISDADTFNLCCLIQLSGMSSDDFITALEYLNIDATNSEIFSLNEEYDHTS